ncbi:hypothetical protein GCM10010517_72410 [Streptosporangium fragile]|uniref:Metalloprotease TldD/E C-terminal domain-containing protein n=1 Tax=Streptosporangium fragile TaxID=46186 RepID=A0ABN3WB09_9ACTN
MIRVFAERSVRFRHEFHPGGGERREETFAHGACVDEHVAAGEVVHRFADGDDLFRAAVRRVDAGVADTAREVQARPLAVADEATRAALAELAGTTGASLVLGGFHQHVATGDESRAADDERLVRTVEVTVSGVSETVAWPAGEPLAALLGRVEEAAGRAAETAALPYADTPPGACDLVLRPGRAGAFFHELVGHPMEADVVHSGTSYLGARRGRRVAPEWLDVVDGGTRAASGFRSRADDEGTPCAEVSLLDRGVVGAPMTDLATARLTGDRASGHGRRLDFRHPAIPRMTHTCALVAAGAEPERPASPWIEPYGLQLEMMNIATGEFLFSARSPVLREYDGPPRRLPPLLVAGDGLSALGALRPCDAETAEYVRATRGCGKLGQFPLLVSFANAGVTLPAGSVTLRPGGSPR